MSSGTMNVRKKLILTEEFSSRTKLNKWLAKSFSGGLILVKLTAYGTWQVWR